MIRNIGILLVCALCSIASALSAATSVPGGAQQRAVALVGGTLHPVSAPDVLEGTLLFSDGRIVAMGKDVEVPADAQRVDVRGKHVYPGLFDASTMIGLVEIQSVRGTVDLAEDGMINPNARAQVAVNPDSELIPVTRSNGVLLALIAPTGGTISGTSAVLQLDGWTFADMTVRSPVGMHIIWPTMTPQVDWQNPKSGREQFEASQKALTELNQAFDDARAYQKARQAHSAEQKPLRIDARWEAMLPVFEGKLPVIVTANDVQQIKAAVAFALRQKIKLILYGGYDAPECAELLKQHQIPVIVGGSYRMPLRRDDGYDVPFTVAERLRAAGVNYCISCGNGFEVWNVRNLPYHAATAVAFGLPADEALKAITLYPAQILGVADRVGSLEVGRDATIFVSDGDPLETTTQVTAAYIQGRTVDLANRQTRLYDKYHEKYRRLQAPPASTQAGS